MPAAARRPREFAGRPQPCPPARPGEESPVQFLRPESAAPRDLTYSDVFLVPSALGLVAPGSTSTSSAPDGTGTTIPLVVANMTAVTGRRMAETVARRGGLAVLPQDVPAGRRRRRGRAGSRPRHPVLETPVTLRPRGHRDRRAAPAAQARARRRRRRRRATAARSGVVTEADCRGVDRFTQLRDVHVARPADPRRRRSSRGPAGCAPRSTCCTRPAAGSPPWCATRRPAGRRAHPDRRPALDHLHARRSTPPAGCGSAPRSGSTATSTAKAEAVLAAGVDVLVVDTAHGHQERMLEALRVGPRARPAGAGRRRATS